MACGFFRSMSSHWKKVQAVSLVMGFVWLLKSFGISKSAATAAAAGAAFGELLTKLCAHQPQLSTSIYTSIIRLHQVPEPAAFPEMYHSIWSMLCARTARQYSCSWAAAALCSSSTLKFNLSASELLAVPLLIKHHAGASIHQLPISNSSSWRATSV